MRKLFQYHEKKSECCKLKISNLQNECQTQISITYYQQFFLPTITMYVHAHINNTHRISFTDEMTQG